MIRLFIEDMDILAGRHFERIYPKVEERFEQNIGSQYSCLLTDDNGQLDKNLVEFILAKNVIREHGNEILDFLFSIVFLLYRKPVKEEKNRAVNRQNRREHVQNYSTKCDLINFNVETYVNKHPDYYNSEEKFNSFLKDMKEEIDPVLKYLRNIFDYNMVETDYRHDLLYDMGVTVCPYCNRQYITNYLDVQGGKKTTADVDHFYPRKYFPFLALSIYNFVPSCQICNSRMKSSLIPNIIYPYDEDFEGTANFEINFDSNNIDIGYLIGESNDFNVDFRINETDLTDKIKASIELFRLRDVYLTHKDYIREILAKKYAYTESNKKAIKDMFGIDNIDDKQIDLIIYGNYIDLKDLSRRPLAKLTKDIIGR